MIEDILKNYDLDKISIATLGSHSALQILHGAKIEGFKTVLIVDEKRLWFYQHFKHLIDEVILVNSWRDICKSEVVEKLRSLNAIMIPHGSYVEYVGLECAEKLPVPIFGLRSIFKIEADQKRKMKLLRNAEIKIPKEYSINDHIDRPVIVKLPGAKGGKGFFIALDRDDLIKGLEEVLRKGLIDNVDQVYIQEYIIGVTAYFQYFYSPVLERLEIMGMDIRYESNVDGLKRVPLKILENMRVEPTFVVIGNIPMVLRESILPKVLDYGLKFVETTKKELPPGMIGPFCLEGIVKDDCDIVIFEFSGRIVAGTNLYIQGSTYSWLYWNEPMSTGKRIAREIKLAIDREVLHRIVT